MTPEQAKKDQDETVKKLLKEFDFWQSYLALGGYGAQVPFRCGARKMALAICGASLQILDLEEERYEVHFTKAPAEYLAAASYHLEDLEKAVLVRIAEETQPLKTALKNMPKTSGKIAKAKP
jgi:hypothetical protein